MSGDEQAGDGVGLPGTFRPRTGSLDAWNAAYVRVEDYLRAHRIHNRLHQSRLIQAVLERAALRHEQQPAVDPTTLAAQEMESMMDDWFADVLDERDQPHERLAVDGRVAMMLCDASQKWPYAFMNGSGVTEEFRKAMRSSNLEAGPDLAVSSMVPRPIDLGLITEAAGETLERFERWPALRALLLWMLFAAALATIFYMTR